jgi:hypothetical protein
MPHQSAVAKADHRMRKRLIDEAGRSMIAEAGSERQLLPVPSKPVPRL